MLGELDVHNSDVCLDYLQAGEALCMLGHAVAYLLSYVGYELAVGHRYHKVYGRLHIANLYRDP